MRKVRILLLTVFCVVCVLFAGTKYMRIHSGEDVAPVITCSQEILDISVLQDESVLLNGMSASDEQDGDLTDQILIAGVSKLISNNTAKVTYMVFDSDDNAATYIRTIRYIDYHRPEIDVTRALNFSRDETLGIISHLRANDVLDGNISENIRVSTLRVTDDSNVYSIVAQVTNSLGDTAKQELYVVLMESDPERPVISLKDYLIYLEQGESFDPERYIGSVSVNHKIKSTSDVYWESNVDTSVPGTYWVKYYYTAGNNTGLTVMTVEVQAGGGA